MRDERGRLLHRYRDGEAGLCASADDYAFFTWGLLELYEATFEVEHLKTALALTEDMFEDFWDDEGGGFYFTPDYGEVLLTRQKETYDGAIPSANSVAMSNLLRLGRITAAPELEERAAGIGRAFTAAARRYPAGHTQLLSAVGFGIGPTYEVVVAGDPEAEDTMAMLRALWSEYIPNKVVVLRPPGESPEITEVAEFTKPQASVNGAATAYVCRDYQCASPTSGVATMLERLKP
jgi:uncharacterized protein YyaL (SSP411 family)